VLIQHCMLRGVELPAMLEMHRVILVADVLVTPLAFLHIIILIYTILKTHISHVL